MVWFHKVSNLLQGNERRFGKQVMSPGGQYFRPSLFSAGTILSRVGNRMGDYVGNPVAPST
jgi:hypothetical protein